MSIWDATRYGWAPIYWLTVEGLPVVWTERATGLTLPTGYTTEAAVLSLAEAGIGIEHIDRQRGVASTAPFDFTLLDSSITHAYLRRWSAETYLTANLSATATSVTVADTAAFPASGSLHIGRELVTYSGKTGTSFTGLTRGVCGYAYAHKMGTSGQTVTTGPRYWLGREVTLWATPCDQGGAVPSTALQAGAVQVWKGRVTGLPQRRRDGFAFACDQLDRLLDSELAGKITGTIKGIGAYFLVDTSATLAINVDLYDAAGASIANYASNVKIWDGSGYAQGDAVTGEQTRVQIAAVWTSWVASTTGASTYLGELKFAQKAGIWRAWVKLKATASCEKAQAYMQKPILGDGETKVFAGGMLGESWIALGWNFKANPLDVDSLTAGLLLELDDVDAADVPASGLCRVDLGGAPNQFQYSYTGTAGKFVYLGTEANAIVFPFSNSAVIGASAWIEQNVTEPLADVLRRTLESSGTGARGVYDTLAQGLGYAIDEALIAVVSFNDPALKFDATVGPEGRAFASMYGGTLGLYRLAVVGRVDDGVWQLRLVGTEPGGTDDAGDLTDADLLAHAGDPVEGVERAMAPNAVELRIGTGDQPEIVRFNALADIEATGKREAEFEVPALYPKQVKGSAAKWILGLFAQDQGAQAVKIRVGPWITAQPGDVVYLDGLTHPALWDWTVAEKGYTGPARVVGRIFDPVTLRVTLTLLVGGGIRVSSLCPSANVLDWDGPAGAPDTITIDGKYLTVFEKCVPCDVIHYLAGSTESTGNRYTISAAVASGTDCILTVDAVTGAHTLDATRSYLTWPVTADSTAKQTRFAHVDDGTSWG